MLVELTNSEIIDFMKDHHMTDMSATALEDILEYLEETDTTMTNLNDIVLGFHEYSLEDFYNDYRKEVELDDVDEEGITPKAFAEQCEENGLCDDVAVYDIDNNIIITSR